MARTAISTAAPTSLGTTTVDTLFSFEGGKVRLFIGSTTDIPIEDGIPMLPLEKIIIPSGLAVSAWAEDEGVSATNMAFGA